MIVLGFLALVSVAALALRERSKHEAALNGLMHERAELHTQLEARDLAVSDLQREIGNLRAIVTASSKPRAGTRTSSSSDAELKLRRQVAELTASQSNALAQVESLRAGVVASASAVEARRVSDAALAALETSANEAEQNAEVARQKEEELLTTLNVPAEVSAMDATTALTMPNLQPYWPYFEAKRQQDNLLRNAEVLRLRLLQETVDSGADATRSNAP